MANAIALAALAVSALSAVAAIATAIFTLAAAVAAIIYVLLTHRLWREAAKDREAQLMLRLMEGYDNLRDAIDEIRGWYLESAEGGIDACERFKEATGEDNPDERTLWIDAQRFECPVSSSPSANLRGLATLAKTLFGRPWRAAPSAKYFWNW